MASTSPGNCLFSSSPRRWRSPGPDTDVSSAREPMDFRGRRSSVSSVSSVGHLQEQLQRAYVEGGKDIEMQCAGGNDEHVNEPGSCVHVACAADEPASQPKLAVETSTYVEPCLCPTQPRSSCSPTVLSVEIPCESSSATISSPSPCNSTDSEVTVAVPSSPFTTLQPPPLSPFGQQLWKSLKPPSPPASSPPPSPSFLTSHRTHSPRSQPGNSPTASRYPFATPGPPLPPFKNIYSCSASPVGGSFCNEPPSPPPFFDDDYDDRDDATGKEDTRSQDLHHDDGDDNPPTSISISSSVDVSSSEQVSSRRVRRLTSARMLEVIAKNFTINGVSSSDQRPSMPSGSGAPAVR